MMLKKITASLLVALLLAGCSGAGHYPANVGDTKIHATEYKNSGRYKEDFAAVIYEADQYIQAQSGKVNNPAIVLDIDETSLSNWPQLEANDYAFFLPGKCEVLPDGPCGLEDWQKSGQAKAFPETLNLFKNARKRNVAVFFLTGRTERVRGSTEANLKKAGYDGWAGVILRRSGTKTKTVNLYKAPERAKLEKQGYTIIANIGDQPSDLAGGYAMKAFLLPNPFYRIP